MLVGWLLSLFLCSLACLTCLPACVPACSLACSLALVSYWLAYLFVVRFHCLSFLLVLLLLLLSCCCWSCCCCCCRSWLAGLLVRWMVGWLVSCLLVFRCCCCCCSCSLACLACLACLLSWRACLLARSCMLLAGLFGCCMFSLFEGCCSKDDIQKQSLANESLSDRGNMKPVNNCSTCDVAHRASLAMS